MDKRNEIADALFGQKKIDLDEYNEQQFQSDLRMINENDPKAHFKKLGLYRKINLMRK